MWPNHDDEEEPEWVKTEREQFSSFRDKNKDDFMDKEEVKEWILPADYDHSEAEAKHLIYESDSNRVCSILLGHSIFPPAYTAWIKHSH